MFHAGERVGVAVSGGPDSVALLSVLGELQPQLGILLGVVHFHHGLRGAEADADAAFVRDLAASLGLEFIFEKADVAAAGDNVEQAGRRLRYEFFRRLVSEHRFDKIAVGHTCTDQAETVLFRFLRGAATAGLGGISPVVDGLIVRPLIEVERADVLEYLRASGQSWREDSSNRSLDRDRNRLRHELLPQLARDWNPAITASLAHVADWARDEEAYWQDHLRQLAPEHFRSQGGALLFEASRLAALPPAVQRRLLRYGIEQVRGDLRGIDFSHVERIRELTALAEGHSRLQIPGVDVFRSFDQVRLAPAGALGGLAERGFAVSLTIPGTYALPQTQTRFVFELRSAQADDRGYNEKLGCLDWERTPQPLSLRNWRPGDRYQPVGWGSQEKLKSLFQRRKVPLWERRHWPVVASSDQVVWTRAFGAAAELAPGPETRLVLEITEL